MLDQVERTKLRVSKVLCRLDPKEFMSQPGEATDQEEVESVCPSVTSPMTSVIGEHTNSDSMLHDDDTLHNHFGVSASGKSESSSSHPPCQSHSERPIIGYSQTSNMTASSTANETFEHPSLNNAFGFHGEIVDDLLSSLQEHDENLTPHVPHPSFRRSQLMTPPQLSCRQNGNLSNIPIQEVVMQRVAPPQDLGVWSSTYFQQLGPPHGLQIAIMNLQQALSGRTVYGIHQSWTPFPPVHRLSPLGLAFGSESFSSPIHNLQGRFPLLGHGAGPRYDFPRQPIWAPSPYGSLVPIHSQILSLPGFESHVHSVHVALPRHRSPLITQILAPPLHTSPLHSQLLAPFPYTSPVQSQVQAPPPPTSFLRSQILTPESPIHNLVLTTPPYRTPVPSPSQTTDTVEELEQQGDFQDLSPNKVRQAWPRNH
ncbi:hypothetical protein E2542_SST21666 [Spatholobus suberectus]|nr:hypothetical protein E2542_SST21666 [Spatholobus suberectus]